MTHKEFWTLWTSNDEPSQAQELAAHLETCAECREFLAAEEADMDRWTAQNQDHVDKLRVAIRAKRASAQLPSEWVEETLALIEEIERSKPLKN